MRLRHWPDIRHSVISVPYGPFRVGLRRCMNEGQGLVRGIRRWDLVALLINNIIGAGIFGLPATLFALAGTYSLLAFVACAFAIAIVALCFAEMSNRFTEAG